MSNGESNLRGPWNSDEEFVYVESPQPAVDGGDGTASVILNEADANALGMMKLRTASDPTANPITGAELGSGLAQGKGAV
ncbi:hypothetical protein ALO94_04129 [Pseudomonas syringae pv. spinaceae]|uniref:Uncharacterized protein n=1 Tax=Pseudomonas syringae pv. spinaceae TaxID=264459 RepID=A0A0Q0GAQ4_PSESX|nr:hypothetical protein ALO94_04129 [Pseudomonas syringae pv. spinaceae]